LAGTDGREAMRGIVVWLAVPAGRGAMGGMMVWLLCGAHETQGNWHASAYKNHAPSPQNDHGEKNKLDISIYTCMYLIIIFICGVPPA
jgi:hypothetical protein